jgi:serine/threonine protein kinase
MLTNEKKLDGRYLINKEIGSGGFGAVYLAEDTRFGGNNRVAIKKIISTNRQVTDSFRQEADLLYNLSHPNLPKVTNCFQEDGASFIVMDYITGEDLADKLKKGKKFSVKEVLDIADKVLDALEYLHSVSIFHRDIKPHNIKIDETGKVFLLDFGTAKGTFDEGSITQKLEQSVVGYTPFYAPLEQILRVDTNSYLLLQSIDSPHLDAFLDMKTDARSDIYSLGATLYHLLTGFSPEKATATVRAHLIWSGKPESLPDCRTLNPAISDGLALIINHCMEIMPKDRFQTAAELRQVLKTQGEVLPLIGSNDNTIQIGAEHIPIQKPSRVQIPVNESPPLQKQPDQSAVFVESSLEQSVPTETALYVGSSQDKSVPTEIAEEKQVLEPIESFFQHEKVVNNKNNSGSKIIIFAGLAFLFLILLGVGGFVAVKQFNIFSGEKGKSEGANNSNSETGTSINAGTKRAIDYSLLVQKMRDGSEYQDPFESSGQEIFENGYRFQMRFTPPDDGFLYVFAEGLNDDSEKIFNIIFPTPKTNDGKADVSAKEKYESGWNEFGGEPGTENFWIIWNKEKIDFLEDSREDAFSSDTGELTNADLKTKLKDYLEKEKNKKVNAEKETVKKLTQVNFEGDSAVYLIELEHR